MAASELAQRAVRVAGAVASPSACWGALQPRPVVPSLPAGGDLRRMGQEGLVTLGCLSTGLPGYGGLHLPVLPWLPLNPGSGSEAPLPAVTLD